MRGDVLTPTIEGGAVRGLAACSCTTAKRMRWAARTPWTTSSVGVLPTIRWQPSRTLAEATWTAGAARRRRASVTCRASRRGEWTHVQGARGGGGDLPWPVRTAPSPAEHLPAVWGSPRSDDCAHGAGRGDCGTCDVRAAIHHACLTLGRRRRGAVTEA